MKCFLFILLFPLIAQAQTVHVQGDEIVYEATMPIKGIGQKELYNGITAALSAHVGKNRLQLQNDTNIVAKGEIILSSPYHLMKKLEYRISAIVKNECYSFKIDSVFLVQKERGEKSKMIPAETLLKGMEVSGPVAANTEKLLNEIDMHIQELLDLLRNDVEKKANWNLNNFYFGLFKPYDLEWRIFQFNIYDEHCDATIYA